MKHYYYYSVMCKPGNITFIAIAGVNLDGTKAKQSNEFFIFIVRFTIIYLTNNR